MGLEDLEEGGRDGALISGVVREWELWEVALEAGDVVVGVVVAEVGAEVAVAVAVVVGVGVEVVAQVEAEVDDGVRPRAISVVQVVDEVAV